MALLRPTRLLISEKSAIYTIKWSYTIIWQVRISMYAELTCQNIFIVIDISSPKCNVEIYPWFVFLRKSWVLTESKDTFLVLIFTLEKHCLKVSLYTFLRVYWNQEILLVRFLWNYLLLERANLLLLFLCCRIPCSTSVHFRLHSCLSKGGFSLLAFWLYAKWVNNG